MVGADYDKIKENIGHVREIEERYGNMYKIDGNVRKALKNKNMELKLEGVNLKWVFSEKCWETC